MFRNMYGMDGGSRKEAPNIPCSIALGSLPLEIAGSAYSEPIAFRRRPHDVARNMVMEDFWSIANTYLCTYDGGCWAEPLAIGKPGAH